MEGMAAAAGSCCGELLRGARSNPFEDWMHDKARQPLWKQRVKAEPQPDGTSGVPVAASDMRCRFATGEEGACRAWLNRRPRPAGGG